MELQVIMIGKGDQIQTKTDKDSSIGTRDGTAGDTDRKRQKQTKTDTDSSSRTRDGTAGDIYKKETTKIGNNKYHH